MYIRINVISGVDVSGMMSALYKPKLEEGIYLFFFTEMGWQQFGIAITNLLSQNNIDFSLAQTEGLNLEIAYQDEMQIAYKANTVEDVILMGAYRHYSPA